MLVHVAAIGSGLDAGHNGAVAVDEVVRAAERGAQLVVLPEYAGRFDPRGVGPQLAEPLDGPFVGGLIEASRRTGVHVVAGTLIPGSRPDRAVNAAVVIGPEGLVGVYRKVHLYDAFGHRESERLEAGPADAEPTVLRIDDLRIGIMTCYDLRFPESARRLVDAGATVLAVPAAWAAGEHKADHWLTLLRARAIENTAYVLGAAQQGRAVAGDSLVIDPEGVVLDSSAGPDPAGAELVGDVVTAVRERNPSLANRRYGVVPALPPSTVDMG